MVNRLMKVVRLVVIVSLMHHVYDVNADLSAEREQDRRSSRFLGLFNVVTFSNSMCNSTLNSRTGLCFTDAECSSKRGTNGGSCASGFGVCCIFESNCERGRSEAVAVQYVQNVDFPRTSTTAQMCLINLAITDDSICQLRLDLEQFSLDVGSTPTTPCDRDSVEIVNSGSSDSLGIGKLCGENGGQHIYVPVESSLSSPMLRILTDDRTETSNLSSSYLFSIKVSQIDCSDPSSESLRAPEGCRQYYRARSGTVSSLNWFAGTTSSYNLNLNYAMCIRRESSDCQLLLQRSASAPPGSTSVGQSRGYTSTVCGPENGCGASECIKQINVNAMMQVSSDRIEVGAGVFEKGNNNNVGGVAKFTLASFFCGVGIGNDSPDNNVNQMDDGTDKRQGVVVQTGGPFVLRFVSDNINFDDNAQATTGLKVRNEMGFSIDYALQTSCQPFNIGPP